MSKTDPIRPSQRVVEQIVARLGELHDPDADLIALVIACVAARGVRWSRRFATQS